MPRKPTARPPLPRTEPLSRGWAPSQARAAARVHGIPSRSGVTSGRWKGICRPGRLAQPAPGPHRRLHESATSAAGLQLPLHLDGKRTPSGHLRLTPASSGATPRQLQPELRSRPTPALAVGLDSGPGSDPVPPPLRPSTPPPLHPSAPPPLHPSPLRPSAPRTARPGGALGAPAPGCCTSSPTRPPGAAPAAARQSGGRRAIAMVDPGPRVA
jgi:hypothetical protein